MLLINCSCHQASSPYEYALLFIQELFFHPWSFFVIVPQQTIATIQQC